MEPTESRYGAPPTPNEIIDLCGDDSDSSVSGSDHPAVPKEAPTEDEGDSDNEGSEDFDDSESLLQDILDFEPDPSELPSRSFRLTSYCQTFWACGLVSRPRKVS